MDPAEREVVFARIEAEAQARSLAVIVFSN